MKSKYVAGLLLAAIFLAVSSLWLHAEPIPSHASRIKLRATPSPREPEIRSIDPAIPREYLRPLFHQGRMFDPRVILNGNVVTR